MPNGRLRPLAKVSVVLAPAPSISLDGAAGVLEVHRGSEDHLLFRAHLPYWEGLIHVVERVGRMVGLDVDIGPAVARLAEDPMIGSLVRARPGIRVPGAWGPLEVAIHVIVAQRCALPLAAERMGSLVRSFGRPVPGLAHGLTHLFPSPRRLARADLTVVGLTGARAGAVNGFAGAIAAGRVDLEVGAGLGPAVRAL